MHRHFILHIGGTNSGKTHDAVEALMQCEKGAYLAPLRLLAYEQYEYMNRYGCVCSLITGEEKRIEENASHCSSTIEMADLDEIYDVVVIDEAQMIADPNRGGGWTASILGILAYEIHVCLAPEAEGIIKKLIENCSDSYEVIYHTRKAELKFEKDRFRFPGSVKKGDALVVFSRKDVHAVAAAVGATLGGGEDVLAVLGDFETDGITVAVHVGDDLECLGVHHIEGAAGVAGGIDVAAVGRGLDGACPCTYLAVLPSCEGRGLAG